MFTEKDPETEVPSVDEPEEPPRKELCSECLEYVYHPCRPTGKFK